MNRYSGWVFLPALLATSVFVLVSFEAAWVGEWNWTIDTITGTTVLTGPLTAALGAHLALAQRRLAPLTDTVAGGWRVPYRAWLQAVMLSGGVYVVAGAGALVVTSLNTPGGPFTWWELLIGFPVIGVCAMFGIAAGHLWPQRATVLLVAPAIFLVGAFGPQAVSGLLRHGPEGGSLGGLRFDPAVVGPQAVALVALLACLGAAVLPWRDRGPRVGLVVASGLSLAALVPSMVWADSAGVERLIASDERPTAPDTLLGRHSPGVRGALAPQRAAFGFSPHAGSGHDPGEGRRRGPCHLRGGDAWLPTSGPRGFLLAERLQRRHQRPTHRGRLHHDAARLPCLERPCRPPT
ncbi:membrane hypothetical protein [metagenome]|uniref:Uncharacterized protein n=1 Tax=metagenome TaxID=256318 RepID=A0A2P2CFP4_9ZZZZ